MISTLQIANAVEKMLNKIATDNQMPFVFKIHDNEGEYKAATNGTRKQLPIPIINGVLLSLPSSIVPLRNVKSYTASQTLTLMLPADIKAPDKGITESMSVLLSFVENSAGLAGTITVEDSEGNATKESYAYVLSPQLPQVGELTQKIVGVWFAPVSLFLTWQFISGGVVGNNISISIDGTPAVLLEGGFTRTRIAETNGKANSMELTTAIAQQGLTLRCLVPYLVGGVGEKLVTDMLTGSLNTSYKVKYEDGAAFKTEQEFDTAKEFDMVATQIVFSFNPGTTCAVDATFVIADAQIYDEEE